MKKGQDFKKELDSILKNPSLSGEQKVTLLEKLHSDVVKTKRQLLNNSRASHNNW